MAEDFDSLDESSLEPVGDSAIPPPLPPPPKSGLLGGKYEPVAPAGEGAMAHVWLGYTHGEAGFRRKVAIKRVLRHLARDETFEQMFVREAHIIAELNHPNITQIHDFGRDDEGGYFIVLEWVSGLNFADYVRAHELVSRVPPWPIVTAIVIEVLRALSAAHSRTNLMGRPSPIIHRDVTPANIMIGFNGSVKLTDFGLSRALDRPGNTSPGMVKGKVAYLAPELFDDPKPDPRCDIFSVGVTLWEGLTGKRLFGGDGLTEVDMAIRVRACDVPKIRHVRPDVPEALDAAVQKALARDPAQRFQRATEMIDALAAVLRAQAVATDGPAVSLSVREAGDLLLEYAE